MQRYKSFLKESKVVGIQHLEHPADRAFDGHHATQHALKTLNGLANGSMPATRKIDDKMSFQVKKKPNGKIGVKYKGSNMDYSYSQAELKKNYADKPHMVAHLGPVLAHIGKALPDHPGEYQGGLMSTDKMHRSVEGDQMVHQPNTVRYSTPLHSDEGKHLHDSKISVTLHTRLNADFSHSPIHDPRQEFKYHPDVHVVPHNVPEGTIPDAEHQPEIKKHLEAATKIASTLKGSGHTEGLTTHLRKYVNKTVRSGETPSTEGFKEHIKSEFKRPADKLEHIDKNKKRFDATFALHHHMQTAANHLADGLDKATSKGWSSSINGQAGGEGYVSNGLKIVNRHGFTRANMAKKR